jgi:hypothetical protein
MGKIFEPQHVEERIKMIMVDESKSGAQISYTETLCDPRFRRATYVGCILSMFQQLSGINAVMFYSNQIFANTSIAPTTGTALVGVVNMVSTLLSSILLAYFGRRTLLWTLSFAMSATLVGLGIAY